MSTECACSLWVKTQGSACGARKNVLVTVDYFFRGAGLMVPDAEVLSVASEILSSLPIGEFQIKLNHRRYFLTCHKQHPVRNTVAAPPTALPLARAIVPKLNVIELRRKPNT